MSVFANMYSLAVAAVAAAGKAVSLYVELAVLGNVVCCG